MKASRTRMTLRSFIFWPHLVAALSAGVVILVMCVTGVLLTFERQLLAWADRDFRSVRTAAADSELPIDELLARVQRPGLRPTTVTLRAGADAPVLVVDGQRTLYVDRYSGAVLGEASRTGIRSLMTKLRAWHRWLGAEGDGRNVAKAVTGWSNAVFLFIVMSGVYLWFPRRLSWPQIRHTVLFNRGARGKARDFNWHNVIGSWCAVPLFIVVLSAMPISFGWFNTLVYRAVGEAPPPPAAPRAATRADSPALAPLFDQARAQAPEWRTISLRLPVSSTAPAVLNIDTGNGGQPHLRSTLTLDAATARVVRHETFGDLTPGRRIRNTMRFAHTGEVLGIPGQAIAGIASAGGAVLVWTGLALTWRRFRAWRDRRRRRVEPRQQSAA
jgi:uncharacterized iron-regulated membrane protein